MKQLYLVLQIFLLVPLSSQAQGTYYNSIDTGAASFVTDLHNLIYPHTKIAYSNYITTNINNFASRDTTGGQKVVTCVYSGENYVYTPPFTFATFSREHTWCHSWMPTYYSESGPEYSDQHHLFPTNQNNANGVRSNHPLGIVTTVTSSYLLGKYGKNSSGQNVYEPRNSHKGDAARALLYMALCYNGEGGKDWTFNYLNTVTLPALSEAPQDVDLLIQWHNEDPPDQWERDRNEYVYSIQFNRNPFIDHPEYVDKINFNSLTRKNSPGSGTIPTGNISITSLTFSYSQNFNALEKSGTSIAWVDTNTIAGWYSNKVLYSAGTGTSNSGALYSFGATEAIERSLGSVASGPTSNIYYAVRFINNSGATITRIPIQYVGKQWRNGGNTAAQSLTFDYKINASSITDGSGWIAVPALDFTSPVATATASALDGNAAANKSTRSSTINLTLLPGQEIWFRWTDINDTGNDHGLAIDDFELNNGGAAMPVELSSFTAFPSGNTMVLNWRTATETNNYGFEIERKKRTIHPNENGWKMIGFVQGNGTTNTPKEYSFVDAGVPPGTYSYRLKQIDRDGAFEYSSVVLAEVPASVPSRLVLEQNFPNPFNPVTSLKFYVTVSSQTTLTVYNAIGQKSALLFDDYAEGGKYYHVDFQAYNLSSGVYVAYLKSGSESKMIRMTLLK